MAADTKKILAALAQLSGRAQPPAAGTPGRCKNPLTISQAEQAIRLLLSETDQQAGICNRSKTRQPVAVAPPRQDVSTLDSETAQAHLVSRWYRAVNSARPPQPHTVSHEAMTQSVQMVNRLKAALDNRQPPPDRDTAPDLRVYKQTLDLVNRWRNAVTKR